MKNTGLFVFLFSLCLCTTSCVDDEADFTGGGNIDVEMPVDPDPDATIDEKVFDVINLDYPGLENVKTAFEALRRRTLLSPSASFRYSAIGCLFRSKFS